jgi:glucokinase
VIAGRSGSRNTFPFHGTHSFDLFGARLAGTGLFRLNLNPGMNCVGIEIGGTKLQLCAGTAAGGIRERRRFEIEPSAGGEGIRARIAEALPGLVKATEARALGVGFGGPVDRARGIIACSHQIAGWSDFPLRDWLHDLVGLPVAIENDANTAALGEARAGVGRDRRAVFYITMGSGIGGGLVVDGQVYHGAFPGEAEIGHLRLDRAGTILEQRCSGWAVDRRIRELITHEPAGELARLVGAETRGEARFLYPAVAANDTSAAKLFAEVLDELAFGLSHVTHLFHPDAIVLGGGLSLIGEPLRDGVQGRLGEYLMDVFRPGPEIVLAALGEDAVPVGALVLAGDCA